MTQGASEQRPMDAAELYRAHADFVARYVYRLGVPPAQVEDVVQEVFIVVHKRGGYLPGPAKPTSYLAAIALHAAAHARRSARRREGRHTDQPLDEHPHRGAEPDHALLARDDVGLVRAALSRLDPALSATLLLADGEEEPCTSIAAAMNVPLGTVYFRLHSARRKFAATVHKLEAQRAHAERQKEPARGLGAPTFARRGMMLGIFAGSRREFEKTRAFSLLRATREADGGRFDAASGLARHLTQIARGAEAPAWLAADGSLAALGSGQALGLSALAKVAVTLLAGGALAGLWSARAERSASLPAGGPPHVEPPSAPALPPEASPPARAPEAPLSASPREPVEASSPARSLPTRAGGAPRRASAASITQQRSAVAATQRAATTDSPAPASAQSSPALAAAPSSPARPEPPEARPEPSPSPPPNPLAELAAAERLATTRPDEALRLIDRLEQSATTTRYLAEELAFVRISAHYHAGHRAEVERRVPAFLADYPTSAFAARVRAMGAAVAEGR